MKLYGVLVDFHRAGSRRYATTGKKCIPNFCEKKYCFQHSCSNSAMLPKDWGLMIEERCKKRFDHHLYITYMQSYNSKFGINTMLMTQCTERKLAPPGKKHTAIYLPNLPFGASLRFRIDWGHRVIMRNGKVCIWYSSNREPLKYWYFPWSISLINCDKNIEKISEGLPRDYA